mgnify:CR=1 FL=1|jgi:hypothetical protein
MTHRLLSNALHEVFGEVRRLRQRFSYTADRAWEPVTAAAELNVQLGHLALCLLRRHGYDTAEWEDSERPRASVGDELADVVLAALSIAVLSDTELTSTMNTAPRVSSDHEALLRLVVAAGTLSESAMVANQYRHRPTGRLPSLAEAASNVIAACELLAEQLGLDLLAEFRAMVSDADAFLDGREDAP